MFAFNQIIQKIIDKKSRNVSKTSNVYYILMHEAHNDFSKCNRLIVNRVIKLLNVY